MIGPDLIDPGAWLVPWGLPAAAVAGVLLWFVGARLALRLPSRAAATALYASAALLVEIHAPAGVNGWAVLMTGVAACLAVAGPLRTVLALVACAAVVALAPVAAVGFGVVVGGLAFAGGLGSRWPAAVRWAFGCGCLVAAAVVPVLLARPDELLVLPPIVLGVLSVWTLLVTGLLWHRLPWLRPVAAAMVATLACTWVPGPDVDAVLLVAAVVAVLTVLVAEEFPALLKRRVLAGAAVAATAAAALLLPGPAALAPPPPGVAVPAAAVLAAPPPPPAARPLGIAIPALDVAGPLVALTADDAGVLSAPADPALAGWYAAGTVPGDVGPAVIGGHVDSRRGPGVFFRLTELRPGDRVEIARSDGRTVAFAVTSVASFAKDEFPTVDVYGPTPGPELRLITCGGEFDREVRSYRDNVVVTALPV